MWPSLCKRSVAGLTLLLEKWCTQVVPRRVAFSVEQLHAVNPAHQWAQASEETPKVHLLDQGRALHAAVGIAIMSHVLCIVGAYLFSAVFDTGCPSRPSTRKSGLAIITTRAEIPATARHCNHQQGTSRVERRMAAK